MQLSRSFRDGDGQVSALYDKCEGLGVEGEEGSSCGSNTYTMASFVSCGYVFGSNKGRVAKGLKIAVWRVV